MKISLLVRLALMGGLLLGSSLMGAGKPLAQFMPTGAVALLETEDLGSLVQTLRQSRWRGVVLKSPWYRTFEGGADYKWVVAGQKVVETALGMKLWTVVDKLLGGQAAVGFYPGAAGADPRAVVVLRVRDGAALEQLRGRLGLYLTITGAGLTKGTLPGGIETWNLDNTFYLAAKGNWVVGSRSKRLVGRTAGLLQLGGHAVRSVAGSAAYKMFRAQMGNRHLANMCVDLTEVSKQTGARLGIPKKLDDGGVSFFLHGIAELAARSPYAGMTLDVGKVGFVLKAGLAGGPRALGEDFEWFFSSPRSPGAPDIPRVPGLIGGISIYRDFSGWYRRREALLAELLLPEFDKFESEIGALYRGKDFTQDVLPVLGPTLSLVAARQDFKHLDGAPDIQLPGFALILNLKDPKKGAHLMQVIFQTIVTVTNFENDDPNRQAWAIATEVYKGAHLTYAKFAEKPKGDALPVAYNFQPAAVRVGNRFVISSSVGLAKGLVDALQGAKPNLARPNRNFNLELQPPALAQVLRDHRRLFLAESLRQGGTIAQARWEAETIQRLLEAMDLLRLSTSVGRDHFEMKLEGKWK